MSNSGSHQPDLDWSQIKETVKLLTVSVALVQTSMKEGGNSVDTLTESFTSMVSHMNAIQDLLLSLEDGEKKTNALMHCQDTQGKIQASIIAFQFYDRLQQCLDHVTYSLKDLSKLIDDPQRIYNPLEWNQFQQSIRNRYTMESEKVMFDAILQGKTMEEAIHLANNAKEEEDEEDIELF